MNLNELMRLSNSFYKKANLEEDMAKRIMYSIIPHLMTPTERQSTVVNPSFWGLDYKALKSAANGVNDLVKYGALACAEELGFYQRWDINTRHKVESFIEKRDFLSALNVAEEAFADKRHWSSGFGGQPWVKIANVLKQLEQKRRFLELVREQAKAPNKDPNENYETLEIDTMKEIIVLMNVFDGLAHNSGDIMKNLLGEEIKDDPSADPSTFGRIERMMDAKELQDPINVFKEVEHIMNQPIYKSTFGDWLSRIRQNPQYRNAESYEEEIEKIKIKKQYMRIIPTIKDKIKDLTKRIMPIIESAKQNKKPNINQIYDVVNDLSIMRSSFAYAAKRMSGFLEREYKEASDEFKAYLNSIKDVAFAGENIILEIDQKLNRNNYDLRNLLDNLSKTIIQFENLIISN